MAKNSTRNDPKTGGPANRFTKVLFNSIELWYKKLQNGYKKKKKVCCSDRPHFLFLSVSWTALSDKAYTVFQIVRLTIWIFPPYRFIYLLLNLLLGDKQTPFYHIQIWKICIKTSLFCFDSISVYKYIIYNQK